MNGILLVNKEKGCTSHDVVYKVKKIFNEEVGHTGTLDPNASRCATYFSWKRNITF